VAVFTEVAGADVALLTERLGAGRLLAMQGIPAGIENSNFFVTTDRGEWVLTLFERLTAAQLPYYLRLMQHLAQQGLPVPEPRADANGVLWQTVSGKPATLVNRLPGRHQNAPDVHHCAQLGQVLARLHLAAADFSLHQPNLRGPQWWAAMAPQVMPHLAPDEQALLRDELAFQAKVEASAAFQGLPRAAVHADLFRDNALFDGLPGHERLTGVFDFYFAGDDCLAYDLAVCLNDWCLAGDEAGLDESRAQALVQAYEQERPLTADEHKLLPAMMRRAALRFWVSRLGDWYLPRSAHLLHPKDPRHFERVLRQREKQPWHALPAR